ncbi:6182_t:CDS:2, partial [Acaulospora colombiana]
MEQIIHRLIVPENRHLLLRLVLLAPCTYNSSEQLVYVKLSSLNKAAAAQERGTSEGATDLRKLNNELNSNKDCVYASRHSSYVLLYNSQAFLVPRVMDSDCVLVGN